VVVFIIANNYWPASLNLDNEPNINVGIGAHMDIGKLYIYYFSHLEEFLNLHAKARSAYRESKEGMDEIASDLLRQSLQKGREFGYQKLLMIIFNYHSIRPSNVHSGDNRHIKFFDTVLKNAPKNFEFNLFSDTYNALLVRARNYFSQDINESLVGSYGYGMGSTRGDGACFFRAAVAWIEKVYGYRVSHEILRQRVVSHALDAFERKGLLDGDHDLVFYGCQSGDMTIRSARKKITTMRDNPKEYVDHWVIQAFSDLLNFHVLSIEEGGAAPICCLGRDSVQQGINIVFPVLHTNAGSLGGAHYTELYSTPGQDHTKVIQVFSECEEKRTPENKPSVDDRRLMADARCHLLASYQSSSAVAYISPVSGPVTHDFLKALVPDSMKKTRAPERTKLVTPQADNRLVSRAKEIQAGDSLHIDKDFLSHGNRQCRRAIRYLAPGCFLTFDASIPGKTREKFNAMLHPVSVTNQRVAVKPIYVRAEMSKAYQKRVIDEKYLLSMQRKKKHLTCEGIDAFLKNALSLVRGRSSCKDNGVALVRGLLEACCLGITDEAPEDTCYVSDYAVRASTRGVFDVYHPSKFDPSEAESPATYEEDALEDALIDQAKKSGGLSFGVVNMHYELRGKDYTTYRQIFYWVNSRGAKAKVVFCDPLQRNNGTGEAFFDTLRALKAPLAYKIKRSPRVSFLPVKAQYFGVKKSTLQAVSMLCHQRPVRRTHEQAFANDPDKVMPRSDDGAKIACR
jgi:hypothetical protein